MHMRPELDELQAEYARLYCQMTGSDIAGTFLTEARHDGSPHVKFVDGKYHYVATERGLELSRKTSADMTEMLFFLLSDVAFWMGVDHEFRNRIAGQDSRRIIFVEWQRLMEQAGPPYDKMNSQKIEEILSENPFDDSLF
jgi:hypothetical protein